MVGYADEMSAAGKPVDDDLVCFILAGLDQDYNPMVGNVSGRLDPIPLNNLYA